MCTAFAAHLTAALMRSTDRLPIIPTGLAPDEERGFFRSGRALSITPLSPLRTLLNLTFQRRALSTPLCRFFVRLNGVSPSRPELRRALRAVAVNTGRKAT